MPLHQFDYLLAIGTIFAFLDAWNIGANDVANSWATSVGSRSVTYIQAMFLAAIMEFSGSLGVGSRVADTIRTKVVDTKLFADTPALLMLGMVCAVTASSLYLTVATRIGLPVSTTHSIMGGVIGMGIAAVGRDGIQWVGAGAGKKVINSGVVSVFMAWVIAPGLAGIFGAIVFTISKYVVLLRENPAVWAVATVPFYLWLTASLLIMLLLWKGGNYEVYLNDAEIAGTVVGAGAAFGIVAGAFLCPFIYRKAVLGDWQLKWYEIVYGPLLLRRPPPPPLPVNHSTGIRNFYAGHLTKEELEARDREELTHQQRASDEETASNPKKAEEDNEAENDHAQPTVIVNAAEERKPIVGPRPEGKWYNGEVMFWYVKWFLFRGVDQDVVRLQNKRNILSGDVETMHARVKHYDNRAEFVFTFLQVLTSCTLSFSHGANDVSNAIGPYASVYQIWKDGALPPKNKPQVPTWILAFGGVAIALGIWTYGYNIMKNLGNRITLHSPTRGFSMELGTAITIILCTRLELPISTTQCITGATVGVGLCSGSWRTINWRMVAWIYGGWIITLPVTGIFSGCLMGIIINAPRWGYQG